jgi:hypothetical protein
MYSVISFCVSSLLCTMLGARRMPMASSRLGVVSSGRARPAPARRSELGEHGHPRMILRRALERGNRVVAEITARELGHIDLGEGLELTALIAKHERSRLDRLAARWLERWLDETPRPTLQDAQLVVALLAALGGPRHDQALAALRDMATRATSAPPRQQAS